MITGHISFTLWFDWLIICFGLSYQINYCAELLKGSRLPRRGMRFVVCPGINEFEKLPLMHTTPALILLRQ